MSAADHELAGELARRLRLADAYENEAHTLLALAHAGIALDTPLASMPETAAALTAALRRLSEKMKPSEPDLLFALGFARGSRTGHALKRAMRQLEDDAILRAVDAMKLLRESEWAACRHLAPRLGRSPKALLHRVLEARAVSEPRALLPEMPRPTDHAPHDDADRPAAPRATL